ncbi:phosphonoacetaldehyde hydrolase [bacterium]|nr:phosphonoacetaldehyde hydrolase [bacterium]
MSFTADGRRGDLRIRAVVLDWLGTTVDFGASAPGAALAEVFKAEGVPLSAGETRNVPGRSVREQLWALVGNPSIAERWRRAHSRDCSEADVARMADAHSAALAACIPNHAEPIPGVIDVVRALRVQGIKIGSTADFDASVAEKLVAAAETRGYRPDCIVTLSDVPEGRPAPWMCFECARRLNVYPTFVMIKADDTLEGIEEGLHAGMWSVGVAATGRDLGLSPREAIGMARADFDRRLKDTRARMRAVGAHFVIDSLAEFLPCLEAIQQRLALGQKP